MGWEWRHGRRYYYVKHWKGGRVMSEYVGPEGSPEVDSVLSRKAAEAEKRRTEREAARNLRVLLGKQRALFQETNTVLSDCMKEIGYHRHARGEWRKKRKGAGGDGAA